MESLNYPLGESLEEREKERLAQAQHVNKHFENLYTNKESLDEAFQSADGQFAVQYSNDPEEVKKRSLNMEYLSTVAGRDIGGWEYPSFRNQYATAQYGAKDINDQQLYDLIAKDFTREKDVRTATTQLYNKAIRTGFEDTLSGKTSSWTEQWDKWRETNKDLIKGEDEWPILKSSFDTMRAAQDALGARGSVAAEIWQTMNLYADGKADEEQLLALGTKLAGIPRDERRNRIYPMIAAAANAEGGDPKTFNTFVDNLQKSLTRGFGFMEGTGFKMDPLIGIMPTETPIEEIEMQGTTAMMHAQRMPPGPEKDAAILAANAKVESVQVVRELRNLQNNIVDPVEPIFEKSGFFASTSEKGLYGISGSIGWLAAASANPHLATAAIWRDEYNKFRYEYPDVPPGVAQGVTLLSAIPQGLIEKLQVDTIASKLPIFSTWLKGIESNTVRRVAAGALGVTLQTGQEFAQDAISEFTPALISTLREDMPDADFGKIAEQYANTRPEVFFASVFFGMLSVGTLDLRDLKNPQEVMNDRFLAYQGYNAGQRHDILSSPDPQAVMRAEYGKRTKSAIANGIKIQEADLAAAERMQNDATMPTLSVMTLPSGEKQYNVTRPAPQETASVTVVNAHTGVEESITMEAGRAKRTAKEQADSLQVVIDCLIS